MKKTLVLLLLVTIVGFAISCFQGEAAPAKEEENSAEVSEAKVEEAKEEEIVEYYEQIDALPTYVGTKGQSLRFYKVDGVSVSEEMFLLWMADVIKVYPGEEKVFYSQHSEEEIIYSKMEIFSIDNKARERKPLAGEIYYINKNDLLNRNYFNKIEKPGK